MAGSNPAFDPEAFREAVRFAMRMGQPNKPSEKVTFKWTPNKTFASQDPAAKPYDFGASPLTTTTHPDVQVLCAVEFISRGSQSDSTSVGTFDNSMAIITLLDEEFSQIQGADEVVIGGNTYVLQFVAPPNGLFGVDVYSVYAEARDES